MRVLGVTGLKNQFFLKSKILTVLPNTQCKRCGWETCADFSDALLDKSASVNDCPPGGEKVRRKLANLLGEELVPSHSVHEEEVATVAFIDESNCIGCAKCLPVCPVDSIIGSKGKTHTVVEEWCTGCRLCASACPTDCINFESSLVIDSGLSTESAAQRFLEKQHREERINKKKEIVENFIGVEEGLKQEFLSNLFLRENNDSANHE